EDPMMRAQTQPQGRRALKRMHFQMPTRHSKGKWILCRDTQRPVMHAKGDIRPERKPYRTAADKSILEVGGVQSVGHHDSLFENLVVDLKDPGGNQTVLSKLT